jgi:hypothetical protein
MSVTGRNEPEWWTFSVGGTQFMPPPSRIEIVIFWTVGIVITIASGAVAIYATHLHLWG